VLEYIQQYPLACAGLTVDQLAKLLNVNTSTIIRAAKTLGYEGYGELRQNLRYQYLATLNPLDILKEHEEKLGNNNLILAQLNADLQNLKGVTARVDLKLIERFAKCIAQAEKTLIVSSGSYSALGLVLSHQCRFIGYELELETRGGSYLTHRLLTLSPQDLLVGITFWRGSREVVQSMEWAKNQGISTACITDNAYSRVAKASKLTLIAPSESTSYYQSLTAGLALVYGLINAVWLQDLKKAEVTARQAQQLYLDFHLQAES
jgi:DNA-binding MurR/RpiR family transcriptional regulator